MARPVIDCKMMNEVNGLYRPSFVMAPPAMIEETMTEPRYGTMRIPDSSVVVPLVMILNS